LQAFLGNAQGRVEYFLRASAAVDGPAVDEVANGGKGRQNESDTKKTGGPARITVAGKGKNGSG